jgi:hypothetical protein
MLISSGIIGPALWLKAAQVRIRADNGQTGVTRQIQRRVFT